MADILNFRARPRSEHEPIRRYEEAAKILFFTGVRYQRMDDLSEAFTPKATRRSSKPTAPRKPPRKRA